MAAFSLDTILEVEPHCRTAYQMCARHEPGSFHSMRSAALLCLSLFAAVPAVAQHRVECLSTNGPQRWKFEAPYLKQAPHGASRPSKYRLVVNWAKGTRQFVDTAPYWENDAGGTANQYCGFDVATHMHVLSRQTEDSMSGYLIDDRSGALLPGGEWILFSPDQKRYLADNQIHGVDGEDWAVYTIGGRLVAKGLAMMTCAGRDYCGGELVDPHWLDNDHLQATTKCNEKPVLHTLDIAQGRWNWSPASPCPAEDEKDYERILARYAATFKSVSFGDSTLARHKAGLRDLEAKLRAIVGPFPVAGFIQPGRMNNDDLFEADMDFP
jgi:hypothetical protein